MGPFASVMKKSVDSMINRIQSVDKIRRAASDENAKRLMARCTSSEKISFEYSQTQKHPPRLGHGVLTEKACGAWSADSRHDEEV